MKLNREKLLEATDKALTAHRERWEREEAKRQAEPADMLTEWLNNYAAKWLEAAERVKYLVVNEYPVTSDDLPKMGGNSYAGPAYGSERWLRPVEPREYVAPVELVMTRNVLAASSDVEIPHSSLTRLSGKPLSSILPYMT